MEENSYPKFFVDYQRNLICIQSESIRAVPSHLTSLAKQQQNSGHTETQSALVEQPIDIHFIQRSDKNHAVGDGRNGKLHSASCLIALLVLI